MDTGFDGLKALGTAVSRLTRTMAILAAIVAVTMMLHVVADIFAKYILNYPLLGTIEVVSGYYMVVLVFFPLALVAETEGHIFVELFTRKLPAPAVRALDAIARTVTILVGAGFAWITADEAIRRSIEGEVWEVSDGSMIIWPSRWILPTGIGAMTLLLLVTAFTRPAARK
jgi:TRAP-type C4-dicarboxylate transport system permease small subunit